MNIENATLKTRLLKKRYSEDTQLRVGLWPGYAERYLILALSTSDLRLRDYVRVFLSYERKLRIRSIITYLRWVYSDLMYSYVRICTNIRVHIRNTRTCISDYSILFIALRAKMMHEYVREAGCEPQTLVACDSRSNPNPNESLCGAPIEVKLCGTFPSRPKKPPTPARILFSQMSLRTLSTEEEPSGGERAGVGLLFRMRLLLRLRL